MRRRASVRALLEKHMSANDLAYNLRVRYQGELAIVVDICRRVDRTSAQIRLAHGPRRLRWVRVDELEAAR